MEPIRVILTDDHPMIRDGIKNMLRSVQEIAVIGEADNGEEAITLVEKGDVDVVLMDINMPVLNGIEATEQILKRFDKVKVLALSMHDEEDYIMNMLDLGASGYILKTIGKPELVEAIKTVAAGESYFSPQVSNTLLGKFMKIKTGKEKSAKQEIPLTDREKEILKLIAEEFTNQEIAEKLFISPRTVDTHRRNLLQKLDAKNTAGLVKYAIQHQLIES